MDSVATLPAGERAELFQETANRRGVATQIIEKDFWVCLTLKQLFELPDIGKHLIFKGGTSLSKIFSAIERFSEDIDVSIDRDYLGFGGEDDPENVQGTRKRKRQIDALEEACIEKIQNHLLPMLHNSFTQVLGNHKNHQGSLWELSIDEDPQVLLFTYPRDKSLSSALTIDYIRPIVKIEIGGRSDHWPAEEYPITPYAAEEFPNYFKKPIHYIKVLEAERTFWEKATILHAEYYRPETSATAERISRHYYDLHRLTQKPIAGKALERIDLLERVVEHKKIFYKLNRAHYDEVLEGSIHLIPNETQRVELKRDFDKMRDMFFGEIPSFDEILETIAKLENDINSKISNEIASRAINEV